MNKLYNWIVFGDWKELRLDACYVPVVDDTHPKKIIVSYCRRSIFKHEITSLFLLRMLADYFEVFWKEKPHRAGEE